MTNKSDIAISVRNLSKSYTIAHNAAKHSTMGEALMHRLKNPVQRVEKETFWALKDVSFDIQKGDVVGIIGRNGAGKSTLLKVLSRITEPTSGKAIMNGRVGSLLEVGTGFHPELTGRENIYMNGAILGMTKREIAKQFDAIVDFAGVEQFLDTPVKRYSSGMYVRLAFAVAAHLNPEILIVDEVLAVGDADFQKKCLGKMQDVANSGRTVLFVSHNMTAMNALCNKGILLTSGRIFCHGNMTDVADEYVSRRIQGEELVSISERPREARLSLSSRLIDVSLHDVSGAVTEVYRCDEEMYVRLKLEAYSDTRFGTYVVIRDDHQVLIWLDSGHLHNRIYHVKKGVYEINCRIKPMFLSSGRYSIDCGLTLPNQDWIDFIPDAGFFEISDCDPYGTGFDLSQSFARYHVDHEWSLAVEVDNREYLVESYA